MPIHNPYFALRFMLRSMNTTQALQTRLSDLPLWRLLVALDDAERTAGPSSATARILAREIQERLRQGRLDRPAAETQGGAA